MDDTCTAPAWDPRLWLPLIPGVAVYLHRDDLRPCRCGSGAFTVFRRDALPPDTRVFVRVGCPRCPETSQARPAVRERVAPDQAREGVRGKVIRAAEVAVGSLDVAAGRVTLTG